MMSSNSFSTDPADDFPEVDDYSVVDDLDVVAAEVAAELAHVNDGAPQAPVEPPHDGLDGAVASTATDDGSEAGAEQRSVTGSEDRAAPTSPEAMAAALAEQVGLDLQDTPIVAGPVDLVDHGLVDEDQTDDGQIEQAWADDGRIQQASAEVEQAGERPVGARAGWFPPEGEPTANAPAAPTEPSPPTQPVPSQPDDMRPAPEFGNRPPSSPPIERAPLVPPPAAEPPVPAERSEATAVDAQARPVDQIAVRKLGGFNFLSIGQWSALPRDERARLVKGGMVMFLYEGEEVDLRPALLWLKQLARSEAADPNDPTLRRRGR